MSTLFSHVFSKYLHLNSLPSLSSVVSFIAKHAFFCTISFKSWPLNFFLMLQWTCFHFACVFLPCYATCVFRSNFFSHSNLKIELELEITLNGCSSSIFFTFSSLRHFLLDAWTVLQLGDSRTVTLSVFIITSLFRHSTELLFSFMATDLESRGFKIFALSLRIPVLDDMHAPFVCINMLLKHHNLVFICYYLYIRRIFDFPKRF